MRPTARRTALHGVVVETIERVYADDLAPHFSALTHHAAMGELPTKTAGGLKWVGRKEPAAPPELVIFVLDAALAAR